MPNLASIFVAKESGFPREVLASIEEPLDAIIVPDGQKKIYTRHEPLFPSAEGDPTVPSEVTTFLFNREDHTLGNLLTTQLRKNPDVDYAGYKMSHPLHYNFELRIHMMPGRRSGYEAKHAVMDACKELIGDLGILGKRVTEEWYIHKATTEGNIHGDGRSTPDPPEHHFGPGDFVGLSIPRRRRSAPTYDPCGGLRIHSPGPGDHAGDNANGNDTTGSSPRHSPDTPDSWDFMDSLGEENGTQVAPTTPMASTSPGVIPGDDSNDYDDII